MAVVALGFVALALAPIAASRPDAAVVITSTGHVSRYAHVTWTLAPRWLPSLIVIASAPALGFDGSFLPDNVVDGNILAEGQTSYRSGIQLARGTYYVRVQAYAADFYAIEWSKTAVLKIAAPPRPAAPPPAVMLAIKEVRSGNRVTHVRIGQKVEIDADVTGPTQWRSDWSLHGRTCLVTKKRPRCTKLGSIRATVMPRNVVQGRFGGFAKLDGRIRARKSVPVIAG